jgi:adenylate kinase family enzyme
MNQLAPNVQRIMIIGRSGSGKSTFAVKLSKIVNIPIFHLDKYFFESNWIERNYNDFLAMQIEMVAKSNWIIDGNSTRSYELRYKRADLCLYFNFPRWLCYWRVLKRLFDKDPNIDDRAPDCQETVRWPLLKYMWSFEARVNPILQLLQSKYPHVPIIELQSDDDVSQFFHQYLELDL